MTTWVRVDTKFIGHPKVLDIGPLGEALWLRGLCYAGEQLTDGFIPLTFVKRMGDMKGLVIAARLVDAGLWEDDEGGYRIHDFLDWQRSRDEVADVSSKRAEAGRRGGKQKASNLLANGQQNGSKLSSKTLPDTYVDTEVDTEEITPPTPPAEGEAPPEPPKPIKPLPEHGEAQKIVAAYCRSAGIESPANYRKAVGQAAMIVKAGVTPEQIPELYGYVCSWAGGADLGSMLSQIDKWRTSKSHPASQKGEEIIPIPPGFTIPPGMKLTELRDSVAYRNAGVGMPPEREAAADAYLAAMKGAAA